MYVRPERPPRPRVAIVGFCQNTRDLCPYDDADLEVWGLNRGYVFMPRADRWFETHGPGVYKWKVRRPEKHLDWLKAFKGPVYLHEPDPDIPNSLAYPLLEVSQDIGVNIWRILADGSRQPMAENPYLTSSIAYELALAIHERFEQIEIYGVDLNTAGEYAWQKPGVEHLIGIAAARGIRVVIPDDCALLKGKLYGRGFKQPEGEAVTLTQYETKLQQVRQERGQTEVAYHQLQGRKAAVEDILKEMVPGIDHEKLSGQLGQIGQAVAQHEARVHQLVGQEKMLLEAISWTPEGQPGLEAIQQLRAQQQESAPEVGQEAPADLALAGG